MFRQIVPYLGGLSGSTVIQKGDVRATLGGGVWRIARLTLESPVLRLMVQGSVTLQGRLDLDVVARTGQIGVHPLLLRALGLSFGGPIGSEALIRASAWLSNRSVQLHVSGTLQSPTIQVRPLRLLTEEAIRFFLLNAAFPAAPAR